MKIFSFNRPVITKEVPATETTQPVDENAQPELVIQKSIHPIKTTDKAMPNIEKAIENDKTPVTVIEPAKPEITVVTPKIDYKKVAITAGVTFAYVTIGYVAVKKILTYFK